MNLRCTGSLDRSIVRSVGRMVPIFDTIPYRLGRKALTSNWLLNLVDRYPCLRPGLQLGLVLPSSNGYPNFHGLTLADLLSLVDRPTYEFWHTICGPVLLAIVLGSDGLDSRRDAIITENMVSRMLGYTSLHTATAIYKASEISQSSITPFLISNIPENH